MPGFFSADRVIVNNQEGKMAAENRKGFDGKEPKEAGPDKKGMLSAKEHFGKKMGKKASRKSSRR